MKNCAYILTMGIIVALYASEKDAIEQATRASPYPGLYLALHTIDQKFIEQAAQLADVLYGPHGADLAFNHLKKVELLLYYCLAASHYQRRLAAQLVLEQLNDQTLSVYNQIQELKNKHHPVSQKLFYKRFILKHQIKHMQTYIDAIKLTWWQKLEGALYRFYELIIHYGKDFFGYTFEPISVQKLSQEIMQYILIERESILYNYKKLVSFLHAKKEQPLPKLLDFWNTQTAEEQLLRRAQQLPSEVVVQFEGLILSFALQGLLMAGGTSAVQWYDDDDKKIFEAYQKKQRDIRNGWQTFQKKLHADQKTLLQNILKAFTTQQTKLQNEYKDSNISLREALVYLNRSINLDKPIEHCLDDNRILLDKHFATSRMQTPQSHVWHNVFNASTSGDWQFDPKTNSFWQNAMTTIPKKLYWQKPNEKPNIFTQDPSVFTIFTEYIPQKLNYEIEIECTLINYQYPFFAGIVFNRGRWISGDPERLHWYRLLCLYGTQGQNKQQMINLSFAQQELALPHGEETQEKIISPLEHIMTNKTKHIDYQLDKQLVTKLATNPITFSFKITTKASSVLLELGQRSKNTTKKIYSGSVHNLDPYIYVFHGIGFMAAGCQAEFKIVKPIELVYDKDALKSFETEKEHI